MLPLLDHSLILSLMLDMYVS